jgi:hypothetical protein
MKNMSEPLLNDVSNLNDLTIRHTRILREPVSIFPINYK